MTYLILGILMFVAGCGFMYSVMSARVAVVSERNFWLETRVSGLADAVHSQARRVNEFITYPILAVRANEKIRAYAAKSFR